MSTIAQMKKQLSDAGIAHAAKATKAELETLLEKKQNTIDIALEITMTDGSVHNQNLSIVNPGGCIFKSQINNPAAVMGMIKDGLGKMYGVNHIRG